MTRHPDARRRMVIGAADMIRRHGLAATSVREPAKHAEAPADDQRDAIDAAAAEVFTAWETLLADTLRRPGATEADATGLATLTVAAVEGSVAMCRAERDIRPLDDVAARLETLLAEALGRPGSANPYETVSE